MYISGSSILILKRILIFLNTFSRLYEINSSLKIFTRRLSKKKKQINFYCSK